MAEAAFRKRMQLYADEGIRHFYFMMLQKEEVSLKPSVIEKLAWTDYSSISMLPKREGSVGLRTILVIQIARYKNGLWDVG